MLNWNKKKINPVLCIPMVTTVNKYFDNTKNFSLTHYTFI